MMLARHFITPELHKERTLTKDNALAIVDHEKGHTLIVELPNEGPPLNGFGHGTSAFLQYRP